MKLFKWLTSNSKYNNYSTFSDDDLLYNYYLGIKELKTLSKVIF